MTSCGHNKFNRRTLVHLLACATLLCVYIPVAYADTITAHANDGEHTENGSYINGSAIVLHVGVGSELNGNGRNAIFSFQLPNFGSVSNPFTSASFEVNLDGVTNVDGFTFNADLYAFPPRPGFNLPVLGTPVYYESDAVDTTPGITLLQTDFITGGSSATPGHWTTTANGSSNLLAYMNAQYANGSGAGEYVFLRLNPDADNGSVVESYDITSTDAAEAANRPRINFTTPLVSVEPTSWHRIKNLYRVE